MTRIWPPDELLKANFTADEAKVACIDTLLLGKPIMLCSLREYTGIYTADLMNGGFDGRMIVWRYWFHNSMDHQEPFWRRITKDDAFFRIDFYENV